MMLREVIAEDPGAIRGLNQLQAFLVELLEGNIVALQVIEYSECNFHEVASSGGYSEKELAVRGDCFSNDAGRAASYLRDRRYHISDEIGLGGLAFKRTMVRPWAVGLDHHLIDRNNPGEGLVAIAICDLRRKRDEVSSFEDGARGRFV